MPRPTVPRCWNCDYDLTGLQVTDICPECGTPVWSDPESESSEAGQQAFMWGIFSLVVFFFLLGPLAALVSIPAIRYGRRALSDHARGRLDTPPRGARAGLVLGWITVVLSVGGAALLAASMARVL